MQHQLPLTGERTVPGVAAENYWFRRHEAAYRHVADLVRGSRVLEVGCGEGYGAALLANSARSIVGLDYDAATVAHASRTYPAATFVRGNLAALPVHTGAVEAVVSLQVVEHVWNHPQYILECARVLAPGGLLVLTTPNRLTFSPGLDGPVNPFHTKEFTADELVGLVESCGLHVDFVGGLHAGPRLRALDRRYGSFVEAQLGTRPERWPARLLADVASVEAADFVLAPRTTRNVDESLDLLVTVRAAAPGSGT